jgi:hypothetical protein
MSRLPLHRLDIPPRDPLGAAADIVIAALRANGIDPRKAAENVACRDIAREFAYGNFTRAQFDHACRNLLILNPKLAG